MFSFSYIRKNYVEKGEKTTQSLGSYTLRHKMFEEVFTFLYSFNEVIFLPNNFSRLQHLDVTF